MSKKATVSGQFNLVDESSNVNFLSFTLSDYFTTITGIREQKSAEFEIIDTDGAVSIPQESVDPIKGIFIRATGEITVKHDSNTAGIKISKAMLLFGEIGSITIETTSTQAITVQYVIFG